MKNLVEQRRGTDSGAAVEVTWNQLYSGYRCEQRVKSALASLLEPAEARAAKDYFRLAIGLQGHFKPGQWFESGCDKVLQGTLAHWMDAKVPEAQKQQALELISALSHSSYPELHSELVTVIENQKLPCYVRKIALLGCFGEALPLSPKQQQSAIDCRALIFCKLITDDGAGELRPALLEALALWRPQFINLENLLRAYRRGILDAGRIQTRHSGAKGRNLDETSQWLQQAIDNKGRVAESRAVFNWSRLIWRQVLEEATEISLGHLQKSFQGSQKSQWPVAPAFLSR